MPSTTTRNIIAKHCGSRKTRGTILEMVKRIVEIKERVIILAPTRVVKKEITNVLKQEKIKFGEEQRSISTMLVTVMCHARYTELWRENKSIRGVPRHIIMDECHFLDPMSIAARGIMEYEHSHNGISITYLSATSPGSSGCPETNYAVKNNTMPLMFDKNKINSKWLKYVENLEGNCLIFVPSKNIGESIMKHFKNSLLLSRSTFEVNYPKIAIQKPRYIFTTDISEMGANYDVDHVLDCQTAYKPLLAEDEVLLQEIPTTLASHIQRRGRVGRYRESTYHSPNSTHGNAKRYVCLAEAQIIMDNLQEVVTPMPEEAEFFEPWGTYRDLKKNELLLKYQSETDFKSIWLCYKLSQLYERVTNSWLLDGNTVYSRIGKMDLEIKPRVLDERYFVVNDTQAIKAKIGKTQISSLTPQRMAFRSPTTSKRSNIDAFSIENFNSLVSMLGDQFQTIKAIFVYELKYIMIYVYNNDLPPTAKVEAFKSILFFGMPVCVCIMTLSMIMCCRGKTKEGLDYRFTTCKSTKMGGFSLCTYLSLATYYGVHSLCPPMLISLFLFLVCVGALLYPSEDGRRSIFDNTLIYFFTAIFLLVVGVISFENGYLPKTQSFFKSIFQQERAEYERSPKDYPLFTIHVSMMVNAFTTFYGLSKGIFRRIWQSRLAMVTNVVNRQDMFVGFSFREIPWLLVLITIIPLFGSVFLEILLGFFLPMVALLILYGDDTQNAVTQIPEKDHTIHAKHDWKNHFWALDRHISEISSPVYHITTCVSAMVVTFLCPNFYNIITTALLVISGISILQIGNIPSITFSFPAINSAVGICFDRHYYLSLPGIVFLIIITGFSTKRRGVPSLTCEDFTLFWKKHLNSLSLEQFNAYKFFQFVDVDKGDYVSRGGNKLYDIVAKNNLRFKGEVVDAIFGATTKCR